MEPVNPAPEKLCYTGVANFGDTFMNEFPLTAAPEVVGQVGDC